MRATVAFALLINLVVTSPVLAEVMNNSQTPPAAASITALEMKYFAHTYSSGLSDRVGRLERFVFGETRNHVPLAQRISRLTGTTGVTVVATAVPPHAQPAGLSQKGPNKPATNTVSKTAGIPKSTLQSNYPRITNLERRLLGGNTYEQQSVTDRLSRLESKLFGKPSTVLDLAGRVDAIEDEAFAPKLGRPALSSIATEGYSGTTFGSRDYSQTFNGEHRLVQTDQQTYIDPYGYLSGVQQFSTGRARNLITVTDQIEFLEMAAFGRIRPNKKLEDRVQALERNLHRETASNDTLTNRVARIWAMAFEQRKPNRFFN